MSTLKLGALVMDQTRVFRKGQLVRTEQVGGVAVTTVDGFAETPLTGEIVDAWFVNVGFTEAAADRDGFVQAVKDGCAAPGEFTDLHIDRLGQGPGYMELGGWLGDQTLALAFMALGQHYGLWTIVTPKTFGLSGPEADQMAGQGMVMLSGFRRDQEPWA